MTKIIFAIDDSPYSSKVVEAAARRVWPKDSELKLLTVLEPVQLANDERSTVLVSEIQERRRDGARKMLEEARKQLSSREQSGQRVHFEIREGNPKQEIVNAAVEWSADKIVVGAHGHGMSAAKYLGSIPRTIAQHAPCTVEVIRAKQS